jgi:hypothetical protein
MYYIDIILRGYYHENDKQFLSKYFIRECKKAQKENYDFDEFFNGLTNGINVLKKECENRFNKRLDELYLLLDGAENKTLKYQNLKTNSIEQEYKKTIDYCESEIATIHFEQFPLNLLHLTNDKYRGHLYYNEIEFINNEITKALVEINHPQLTKTQKKTTLTNDAYYSILEKCAIEAFECLKLKDLYPKDGTKAIWDISTLTITKGDGLPTERDNELFKTQYIRDNMRVTFLMALERHSEKFQKKHSITRSVFYKKCYQSILTKVSESPLWNKPDFGFNINKPCELTFIWSMRNDIEARSVEPKATIKQPETLDLFDTSTVERAKPKKLKKVLFQFIHNISNKVEFTKELKETFPTEIGKSIKAIIDILSDEKILVYGTKEFKTLYEEIYLSFNRDIGTYNSIQNVKIVDKETTDTIYKKLNPLITKHKTS